MDRDVVPMIHVPDVRATVEWYQSIGFTVDSTHGDDGNGLSFARMSYGSSAVMFNEGGKPSTNARREFDLYVFTVNVDELYQSLKDRVDVVEGPHDTFTACGSSLSGTSIGSGLRSDNPSAKPALPTVSIEYRGSMDRFA